MKRLNVFGGLVLLALSAAAQASDAVKNWAAPSSWTPPSTQAAGRSALATYKPLPFVPITPCRVIDTRVGSGFPIGYGPPSMGGGGAQRSFTITGQCGVPATGVQAISFNFAVFLPTSRGDLRVFPAGGGTPLVSTMNWESGIFALANAAIVPVSAGGAVTVQIDGPNNVDIFVDINGFYGITPADPNQFFTLNTNSTGFTMRLDNASAVCGGPCGIWQTVASGIAIEGDTTSGLGIGAEAILGSSINAMGVKGHSDNTNGMWAESTTFDALAAFGGRDGAFAQGARFGVFGNTTSTANGNAGVLGTDGAGAGALISFFSAGVRGEGRNGVIGFTNTAGGFGVMGMANSPATIAVIAEGNFSATGTKAFVEPHPTDPMMTIRYVALEGPEAGTYFRGTAQTVNHEAVIPVPESFRIVSAEEGLTVQLTPVGALSQMAVLRQDLNQIVVISARDVTFHYHVNGIRRAFKDWQVVTEGYEFRPVSADQKMPGWVTEEARSRLISNGTYNPDGTVNMNTAERMGWAKVWREEAAAAAAAHK